MVISCILSILTSPFFIADLIFGIICIEYALYKCKPLRKVDEARDSKYSAFRRYDVKYWNRARLYLASPLVFIRFAITVFMFVFAYVVTRIINFNVPSG